MENQEKIGYPTENFENINFETENAIASITVNHENRTVWINDLRSFGKGQGYGSKLLDELKKKYSEYTITGQASPTEFDIFDDKPTDEEMLNAYHFGLSPAGTNRVEFKDPGFELTSKERDFVDDVAQRFNASRKDPVGQLFNFYRKNGLVLSPTGSGFFESNPPHKLSTELNK